MLSISVCASQPWAAQRFANEAINQLAEKYLELKQVELGRRIPHEAYPRELQKVRMYLADRNAFGVDLNPVAVELAEVSCGSTPSMARTRPKTAPASGRVPWFGYQLFAGNSRSVPAARCIAPRNWSERQTRMVRRGASPAGPAAPGAPARRDLPLPAARRAWPTTPIRWPASSIQQILTLEAVAQRLYQAAGGHEIARLQQLSALVDDLWQQHQGAGATARPRRTRCPSGRRRPQRPLHARAKEAIRKRGLFNDDGDLATPFRRLKLVMDYWCALWFWPIRGSSQLPAGAVVDEIGAISRAMWWT
jgi:hypothetical protein